MKSSIIQIGDKAYQETEVVMLPTDKKGALVKLLEEPYKNYGAVGMIANNHPMREDGYWQPQHLYFLSNEEIKEGDWRFNILSKEVDEFTNTKFCGLVTHKKIIASTDPELKLDATGVYLIGDNPLTRALPRPSNEFLEAYVKAQGKGFEKVLVQTEDVGGEEWMGSDHDGEPFWHSIYQLKVAQDNTITCKKVEQKQETFTREEVIKILSKKDNNFSLYRGIQIIGTMNEDWFNKNY